MPKKKYIVPRNLKDFTKFHTRKSKKENASFFIALNEGSLDLEMLTPVGISHFYRYCSCE